MTTTITIFRFTVSGGLVAIEVIKETHQRARRWAMEALHSYASNAAKDAGSTQAISATDWVTVGACCCACVGDYFAVYGYPTCKEHTS